MATCNPPAALSERIAVRVPDCAPEPWLRATVDDLREFPRVEFAAWMGRLEGSCPASGDIWIDEMAPDTPERLHGSGVTLVVDLSERPLSPDFGRLRRWLPLYGEAALPRFSFADALLDHRRAVLARLVEVAGEGAGKVLEEGRLRPLPHAPQATYARLRSVIARWPARVLARMHAGYFGPGTTMSVVSEATPANPIRELAAVAGALAARLLVFATEEKWAIGVVERPIARVLEGIDAGMVRWLPAPDGGGLTDPFALAGADGRAVLAELERGPHLPGVIVSCSATASAQAHPVLPLEGHASYPFLIADDGEIFMLPEYSASGRVQLFRADPFPERWLPDAVLLDDLAGVDPTVVNHDGRWWLFVGDLRDQADARLHLFMADRLRGPWRRHLRSPVKDDLASARPAGTPFVVDGQLYRPSQDCSRRYGEAVVIQRVDVLTPEVYAETPVLRIEPDPAGPYPHGLHTISAAGGRTLIDGKRERRSLRALLRALMSTPRPGAGR
jgi:hypothetical protein